jgi:hypothetical protein
VPKTTISNRLSMLLTGDDAVNQTIVTDPPDEWF